MGEGDGGGLESRSSVRQQRISTRRRRTCLPGVGVVRNDEDLVEVVQDEECIRMMQEFIARNPRLWNEDIGV